MSTLQSLRQNEALGVGAPASRRGDKKDSRESKLGPDVDFDITPFVFVPVPPRVGAYTHPAFCC
jgi:hypothetical protein